MPSTIGTEGRSDGSDRSARADISEEADGWIDSTVANDGHLDGGFGCFLGEESDAHWSVCLTFGEATGGAVENARLTLDEGTLPSGPRTRTPGRGTAKPVR